MASLDGVEHSELFQAQTHLYKHTFNFLSSMSLKLAVELGIPDIIHNHGKPITLPELASALQLHPSKADRLSRFLRLLVHNGFFKRTTVSVNEEEKEAYLLTPPSKLLLKGKEFCLSPVVEGSLRPHLLSMWHSARNWFHGNDINNNNEITLFETAHGMNYWDYIGRNPELTRSLDEGMMADSQMMKLALKNCKEVFENLGSIVDVGGGSGTVARIVCEAFPNLKYIVLDLPGVVNKLSEGKNLSFVGGDMFQSIPPADAALLKWVLHDWSDEHCIKILKNCKEAISNKGKEGKVIIIDVVIDEKKDDPELTELKLYYDILMMAQFNGRERDEKEWQKLFLEAGFRHYKIIPLFGFKSLIKVYP